LPGRAKCRPTAAELAVLPPETFKHLVVTLLQILYGVLASKFRYTVTTCLNVEHCL
jgi:hypothetical protein